MYKFPWQRICYAPEGGGAPAAAPPAAGGAAPPAGAPSAGGTPPAAGAPPAGAPPAAPAGEFQLTADDTAYMDSLVSSRGYDKAFLDNMVKDPHGYKALTTMREQHRLLTQFQQGSGTIVLPKDPTDAKAMEAVYDKLGRPAKATDYKIEIPQGGDSAFAVDAATVFHKTGLNQGQVEGLTKWWNEYAGKAGAAMTAETATKDAAAIDAVQNEWGANATANNEVATRGLNLVGKALGWDANKMEQVRNSGSLTLDAGEVLKLSHQFGTLGKTTGDNFEGAGPGQRQQGGGMTPTEAKARIDLLTNDRAFYNRLQSSDANAKKEWDDLHVLAAKAS